MSDICLRCGAPEPWSGHSGAMCKYAASLRAKIEHLQGERDKIQSDTIVGVTRYLRDAADHRQEDNDPFSHTGGLLEAAEHLEGGSWGNFSNSSNPTEFLECPRCSRMQTTLYGDSDNNTSMCAWCLREVSVEAERASVVAWIMEHGAGFSPVSEARVISCAHGQYGWEDCQECCADQIAHAIETCQHVGTGAGQ